MFTGLVQACPAVVEREGMRLKVSVPELDSPLELGESVAINGVCLTVISCGDAVGFDVSEETFARTSLGDLVVGDRVNWERAMRPMDRFGGHIVQGHVDQVGSVIGIEELAGSWTFRFEVGIDGDRYLIDKGSVTIQGVSLTVVSPQAGQFEVAVIPHTFDVTTLGSLSVGSRVNVEFDVLAKHVEKLLSARS
ncbi:hypothetical protein CCB80_13805 [Armatimonadetes bacterium Uphvl-Ar1]|nr:hypothetical protein CCB80_13805 [Armatimonadetes bacterium Uphvl-Ar1]